MPPFVPFGAFVAWLLVFPMGGPLLSCSPGVPPPPVHAFLVPHAAALLYLGWFRGARNRLDVLAVAGGVLSVALTLAYGAIPTTGGSLLFALGVASAPLSVRTAAGLAAARRPVSAAVYGLLVANVAFFLWRWVPGDALAHRLLASGMLLGALATTTAGSPATRQKAWPVVFGRYPAFLFAAHGLYGLAYARLFPAYEAVAVLPGAEVAGYAAAVWVAYRAMAGRPKALVVCSVVCGFAAAAPLRTGDPSLIHDSMGLMQVSSGFMDLLVLVVCLSHPDPKRGFGLGLGAVCAGISMGSGAAWLLGSGGEAIPLAGAFFLVVAGLVLFLGEQPPQPDEDRATSPGTAPLLPSLPRTDVPLSPREQEVLTLILSGHSTRTTASRMGLSPSSVQTYTRRIYAKAGVEGRDGLLALAAARESEHGPAPLPAGES